MEKSTPGAFSPRTLSASVFAQQNSIKPLENVDTGVGAQPAMKDSGINMRRVRGQESEG